MTWLAWLAPQWDECTNVTLLLTVFIFVTKAGALNHPKKEVTKTGQNNLIASKKLNSVQHVEPNLNILSCYILGIALGAFLVASKLQV